MTNPIFASLFALIAAISLTGSAFAQNTTFVPGYIRKNGTYVQPHYRTLPNSTKIDNFSTKPNVNPYTGKTGTVIIPNSYYGSAPPLPPAPAFWEGRDLATQCLGTTQSGNQCRRMTKNASGYCHQH